MGQIVVNVGSFDLTSHNGNTAYSTTRYFDIPANAGITGCVATFATHVNTGNFQGKSFSLNSVQAHPNTPWPTSGIALNPALLSAGQNAFRGAVKSQAGLSARWKIGDIYLTITYNDVGGGGGAPPTNIGAVTINKTTLTAGDTITVSASACDAVFSRSIYLMLADNTVITTIASNFGTAASSWTVTVPTSLCASYASDSETLILKAYMEVYQTGTYVGSDAKNFTMYVPASAVPTIGTFTATRNNNGVDASITKYVQNYSKVNLAMGSVTEALGSGIQSYEITGAGFSAAASSAAFGPFAQTGDITFTAKVTDTRGRTATKTVTINMLAYTPVSGVNLTAYRSDASKAADDEGAYATLRGKRVFSSLDGQNAGTIKGRVYEKDTTAPGWTNLTDDTLTLFGGGTLSQEKGYTAEISINDKITSIVYVIQIPTATVGIHILPGATGMGLGEYGESGKLKVAWPIYSQGQKVALDSYPVGAVFISIVNTSPATLFGGTWSAITTGKFLRTGTGGSTGGSDTHGHAVDNHVHSLSSGAAQMFPSGTGIYARVIGTGGWTVNSRSALGDASWNSGSNTGVGLMGNSGGSAPGTNSASNVPAYYGVYAWRRTA